MLDNRDKLNRNYPDMLKTIITHHYYKHVVIAAILICLCAQLPVKVK